MTTDLHPTLESVEASWKPIAEQFRAAAEVIRPDFKDFPRCMPGEEKACGGSFAEHALSAGAWLGAAMLHHAEHSGPEAVTRFWDQFDAHRFTLARHHGDHCDCADEPDETGQTADSGQAAGENGDAAPAGHPQ